MATRRNLPSIRRASVSVVQAEFGESAAACGPRRRFRTSDQSFRLRHHTRSTNSFAGWQPISEEEEATPATPPPHNAQSPHTCSTAPMRNFDNIIDSGANDVEAELTRRKLRFFFMNPLDKARLKHRSAIKLSVQLLKIVIVTWQVVAYSIVSKAHLRYRDETSCALKRLFFGERWVGADFDVEYYADYYAVVDRAVQAYFNVAEWSLGSFSNDAAVRPTTLSAPPSPRKGASAVRMTICQEMLLNDAGASNTTCHDFNATNRFSSQHYFEQHRIATRMDDIVTSSLYFPVYSIQIRDAKTFRHPIICLLLNVVITFDNSHHDGRVPVTLSFRVTTTRLLAAWCGGASLAQTSLRSVLFALLDGSALVACSLSFYLCSRGIVRAQALRRRAAAVMQRRYSRSMSLNEKLEFINLWYVMIIANDVLIACGTLVKLSIQAAGGWNSQFIYDACRVLLGAGTLLVWLGVLRYLAFFPTYNILILTMKRAMPTCLRFGVCVAVVFCAFAIFGTAVFAPYMKRFETFNSTCEVLFTFLNPSAVFHTFSAVTMHNQGFVVKLLWDLYLYAFQILYNMIVCNFFVTLVTQAYQSIVNDYDTHARSTLHDFIVGDQDVTEEPCQRCVDCNK